MISVLPSVCLIFQATDCTQPEESLKQGQEGGNERKTLGWRKERNKWQRGDGMKEWKQRFMSMYVCLYVCVQIKKWGYLSDSNGGGRYM